VTIFGKELSGKSYHVNVKVAIRTWRTCCRYKNDSTADGHQRI